MYENAKWDRDDDHNILAQVLVDEPSSTSGLSEVDLAAASSSSSRRISMYSRGRYILNRSGPAIALRWGEAE